MVNLINQPIKKKCEDDLLKFFLHGHYDVKVNYNKCDEQLITVDDSVAILNDVNKKNNNSDDPEQEIDIITEQSEFESKPDYPLSTQNETPTNDYYDENLKQPQCVYEEKYVINISVKPKSNDVNKQDNETCIRKSKQQTFAVSIEKTTINGTSPQTVDVDDEQDSDTENYNNNNSLYESDEEYYIKNKNWTGPIITEAVSENESEKPFTSKKKSIEKDLSLSDTLHKTHINIASSQSLKKDIYNGDIKFTDKKSTISSSAAFYDDSKPPTYINEIISGDWYIDENGIIQSNSKYFKNMQKKNDYTQLKSRLNTAQTTIANTTRNQKANSNYPKQNNYKDRKQDVSSRKTSSVEIDQYGEQQEQLKNNQSGNKNPQYPFDINEILKGNICDDEKLIQYLDYIERKSNQEFVVKRDTQQKDLKQQFQPSSTSQTQRENNVDSTQFNASKKCRASHKPPKQKTTQTKTESLIKSRLENNNLAAGLDKIYRSLTVTDILEIYDEVRGKTHIGDGQNHQKSKINMEQNGPIRSSQQVHKNSSHSEAQCRIRQGLQRAVAQPSRIVRQCATITAQQPSYVTSNTSTNKKHDSCLHRQLKTSETIDLSPSKILCEDQHNPFARSHSNINLKAVRSDRNQLLLEQHLKYTAMYNAHLRRSHLPVQYRFINPRIISQQLPRQATPFRVLEQHFRHQFNN
ncbi:unnamed protein product [Didymodactylos carnosus]|uniref:Uncharacterized protein n=1 Tax=Didymodactylos carnosus TaxID=1234261 RepID=A0A8S2I4M9_9BILA|nr:unnamed protein product [Didymodactylos carnosus]